MPLLAVDSVVAVAPAAVRVLGAILLAGLAAAALLAPSTRVRALAVLAALVFCPVLLLLEIWNTPQLDVARERPLVALGGGAVAALAVCAPLAVLFARRPWVMTLCVAAVLPFRVPVEAGARRRTCSCRSTS